MRLTTPFAHLQAVPLKTPFPGWRAHVNAAQWSETFSRVRATGGRLVALWGSDERRHAGGFAVHAALHAPEGLLTLSLPLADTPPRYPDVARVFPAAGRMQRAVYDLLGIVADGAADVRPWLRHAAWPEGTHPLRKDFPLEARYPNALDDYAFVRVAGDGVHEIPVGPVHAGTIEPGHFRFSVVGEKILRLEERLGYKHKAIEKLFETKTVEEGVTLAARVSGDATVAYAWAYCMAAESAARTQIPPRAAWLRGLALELERIANHLGDLGYLGNDVALAFGFAQFWRLKEELLRTNAELFGHRYLMDLVVPGGVARDMPLKGPGKLLGLCERLAVEVESLRSIYDEHPGVQDRYVACGRVPPALAEQLGLTGLAGRASGLAWDLRVQFPVPPYDLLDVQMATHRNGDVAARVAVRFDEVQESLRLVRELLENVPGGRIREELGAVEPGAFGVGWVEGWRGEVLVALHVGEGGCIHRCHPHDPSWQNWPVLEHAVLGNIVPDFPLINKSFNLSYSGHDL